MRNNSPDISGRLTLVDVSVYILSEIPEMPLKSKFSLSNPGPNVILKSELNTDKCLLIVVFRSNRCSVLFSLTYSKLLFLVF